MTTATDNVAFQETAAQALLDELVNCGHDHDVRPIHLLDALGTLGLQLSEGSAATVAYLEDVMRAADKLPPSELQEKGWLR